MLSGLSKDVPFFSRLRGPAEWQFQNQILGRFQQDHVYKDGLAIS
jgi:hypothetical protein